jgi:hypothetical protein
MEVQGGEEVQLLLIHDLDIRCGVVSLTPRPRITPGKGPPVPIVQEAGWAPEPVWTQRIEEKYVCLCRGSNQSVTHYTDWATPARSYCMYTEVIKSTK